VQAEDPETAVGHIIGLVKTRIPKRFGSIHPRHPGGVIDEAGRVGAQLLNIELQAVLNRAGGEE
jgi:hypothetical protein